MGTNEEKIKGKAQEIKGHIKHGVGRVIDDEQMEAEGYAEEAAGEARQDAAKAAERARGAGEELKGKIKNAAGDLLDDEQLEAEGRAEELKGKARQRTNE
jgi:uncharacterized protein YjbJ (UPF0337 family)